MIGVALKIHSGALVGGLEAVPAALNREAQVAGKKIASARRRTAGPLERSDTPAQRSLRRALGLADRPGDLQADREKDAIHAAAERALRKVL